MIQNDAAILPADAEFHEFKLLSRELEWQREGGREG